jgi:hypothetical protein
MPDLAKLNAQKEKILQTIRIKGPSLPVHISKILAVDPIFASAYLSELLSEKRIKISNMKVGSSPLYYLEGQEQLLEKFSEHLNHREKEALTLLKEKQILSDEEQTPVIRVALRALKDFAVPIRANISGETKLFWKHSSIAQDQVRDLINSLLAPNPPKQQPETQEVQEKEDPALKPTEEQPVSKPAEETEEQKQLISKPQEKPKKPIEPSKFSNSIKSYLQNKDIELLSLISEKKKETLGKVRIDTLLGKQELYLIAKDKKTITEDDITLALQKAQTEKMQALILSPGTLNKKSEIYLKEWKNLVKFEKLNL